MIDPKVAKAWDDFINPDVVRPSLVASAMFVMAFEHARDMIIRRIRAFFAWPVGVDGEEVDPEYQRDVLSRNRSAVYASLEWLKDQKAITDDDVAIFNRAKTLRNKLAHDLLRIIGRDGMPSDFAERFDELLVLIRKIETWWIINVDLTTTPNAPQDVKPEDISPGSILMLQMLAAIAMSDPDHSRQLYAELRKALK
jgi:hypothetical protein